MASHPVTDKPAKTFRHSAGFGKRIAAACSVWLVATLWAPAEIKARVEAGTFTPPCTIGVRVTYACTTAPPSES